MPFKYLQNTPVLINAAGALGTYNAALPALTSTYVTATIANGASSSGAVACAGARGLSVETPSAWTAADIGFSVSQDGSTWIRVATESAVAKITNVVTNAAWVYTAPSALWSVQGYAFLRIESLNTATGAAAAQGAERTLKVALLL